jgi:phospholipase C
MNGFAQQSFPNQENAHHVMGAHPKERLPISYFLAEEFAVFDQWFCSVPGNTQPNRMYVHSATSDGMAYNDIIRLVRGLPQDPILKMVRDDGYTWSNYFQQVPSLALLQWPRKPINNDDFQAYQHYQNFKTDAMNGNLANVVFIDPRYTDGRDGFNQNDDHPGGADMVFMLFIIQLLLL